MSSVYTTVQGDVWDLISYKVYGYEGHIDALIGANPQYRRLVVLPGNIELSVPDKPEPSPQSLLPPWKRG